MSSTNPTSPGEDNADLLVRLLPSLLAQASAEGEETGDAQWLIPRMLKGDPDGETFEERRMTMSKRLRRAPPGVIHYCADVKENGENGFRRQVSMSFVTPFFSPPLPRRVTANGTPLPPSGSSAYRSRCRTAIGQRSSITEQGRTPPRR